MSARRSSLTSNTALERNLRLYPWLHVGRNALFWLPVFVLYFSAHLPPAEVLRLEALYYAGVVLLEVPSGYLSDRVGRRPVLLVAAVAWALGSAVIAVGGSWWNFAAGQLLLALGMAFQSGTDTSLLYDTLVGVNREHELARREAHAQSWAFATLGAAALVGGVVGGLDLRLGHALTAVAGCIAVVAALGMTEPPSNGRASAPIAQLADVMGHGADPVLRWTFIQAVGFTVAVHIPYELIQPWLEILVAPYDIGTLAAAPPLSGAVVFAMMMTAAALGPRGPGLAMRVGPAAAMLACWSLMVAVLASMAMAIHPVLLPLLALRSVPTALAKPILAGITHPRLPSRLRATWLSVESLAGRLAFAALLFGSASVLGTDEGWTFSAMRTLLLPVAVGGASLAIAAWWLRPAALTWPGAPPPPPTPRDQDTPR